MVIQIRRSVPRYAFFFACFAGGFHRDPDGWTSSDAGIMLGPMLDPKVIDDLSRKLAKSLPGGLVTLQEDFQRNAAASLQAALARLDLVTREEFDVQQAVLARTREKLQALEQQVAALEAAAREPDSS